MKLNLKHFKLLGMTLAFGILIAGCYPGGPEYNSDYSLVVTDYDNEFDFGSRKTYYLPDTIGFQTNTEVSDAIIRQYEELILDLVESNMNDRNYTRIDTSAAEPPDLVISVTAIAIENSGVGWVPGPCWSYWCWYYPNWYPVGYSYSTGTVLITMGDPQMEIDPEDDIIANIVWVAGLDGLLSSNINNNVNGVTKGINQAFEQSQYIQSNQ